jgi:hypothetical protein
MKVTVAITTLLAVALPQQAAGNEDWVRAPSLAGLTVDEAAAQLRAAGLRPEDGTRLEPRGTTFAPGSPGRVTSQSIPPGTRLERGAQVVVGTTGPGIDSEQWNRIGFEHGRIVLGDLSRACVRYDHATIGATSNGARTIRLWGARVKGCEPARRLELQPPADWTIHTNAVPHATPALANPWLTVDRKPALDDLMRAGPVLMPDRRSVLVRFDRGPCHGVAATSAVLRGRTIRLRVTLGARPGYDGFCFARRDSDSVLIRLPRPAPLGVTFKD